jgi:hypothetical protein
VTEPDDPFDAWLHTQVEPLRPPPGTFDQIRTRAKRRKRHRALMSAASAGAAAVIIVACVVALPRLVPSVLHPKSHPVGNSAAAGPLRTPRHTPVTQATTPPTTATTGSLAPVPAGFAPSSVTFVSASTGFVIGQTSECSTYCTAVAGTTNSGQSWFGVGAPPAGAPDGSSGVSQVRFLSPEVGWAFGPELYMTQNGGQTWTQADTHGLRVTDLETVGDEAYAVFAQCSGTGTDYAVDCTHVSLESSSLGSNVWTAMPGLQGLGFNLGDVSGKILLYHTQGFFYAPDGVLYGGSTSGANWQRVSTTALPCMPPGGEVDGQSPGGQLAAATGTDLALACPVGISDQQTISTSSDGGQNWVKQATATVKGSVTSLTAGSEGTLALATTEGIYFSADNGLHWQLAEQGPSGGFGYVGMTTPMQGVAVPAEASSSDSIWLTANAGENWQQLPISSGS